MNTTRRQVLKSSALATLLGGLPKGWAGATYGDDSPEVKQVRFGMANGMEVVRDIGYVITHAGGAETIDEIVFGEPGDLVLLGARSLQGLNLKVDLVGKRLVAGGPMLAAMSRRERAAA